MRMSFIGETFLTGDSTLEGSCALVLARIKPPFRNWPRDVPCRTLLGGPALALVSESTESWLTFRRFDLALS